MVLHLPSIRRPVRVRPAQLYRTADRKAGAQTKVLRGCKTCVRCRIPKLTESRGKAWQKTFCEPMAEPRQQGSAWLNHAAHNGLSGFNVAQRMTRRSAAYRDSRKDGAFALLVQRRAHLASKQRMRVRFPHDAPICWHSSIGRAAVL